jgi:phosphoglycerate kinase
MNYNKKCVEDIDVSGKRVLVRCDFNVPVKDGVITDDKRIQGAMKTICYLMEHGAKVILCSHMGRPHNVLDAEIKLDKKEKKKIEELPAEEQAAATAAAIEKGKNDITKLSLKIVADDLAKKGVPVTLASDVIGPDAQAKAAALKNGEVLLLENVRFHAAEEKNDPAFAKALASLAEIYVNDAFGTAHRAHASTAGVADYLPAVCGYLIQKEIGIMGKALEDPKRPFVAILGGAKVSDKIGVINNLIEKVDMLIIGGGMAYTFFRALGSTTGSSLCEEDKLDLAKGLIEKARAKGVSFLLPVDNIIAREYKPDATFMRIYSDSIPDGWMGLDIGEKTQELFAKSIAGAGTVVWNGPMGVSEWENFASGTRAVAKAVAESGAISIIGGGDSAAAVEQLGYADKMTHISTGGGASLEFLEGIELPGIACLLDK